MKLILASLIMAGLSACARNDGMGDYYRAVSIIYSYPKREVCVPPKISQNNICMTKEEAR